MASGGHKGIQSRIRVADIRRLVTFGTSLTALGGWQNALSLSLANAYGHHVEVETVAEAGRDSRWALANVDRVIARSPDLVLIEFTVNDASILHLISLRESEQNTVELVTRIQNALPGAIIFLMAMSPFWGRRSLIRPQLERYYNQQEIIARELNVGFIDHRPKWRRFSAADIRRLIPDGAHPLPAVIAQIIVPSILAALSVESVPQ